eukprot:6175570-Pleurochrysis_carterae.AAC.1
MGASGPLRLTSSQEELLPHLTSGACAEPPRRAVVAPRRTQANAALKVVTAARAPGACPMEEGSRLDGYRLAGES